MIYRCNECGYENNKYFGLCPKCRNGEGVEVEDKTASTSSNSSYRTEIGKAKTKVKEKIKCVNKDAPQVVSCRNTQFENFNAILSSSKGFIEGQVILMGANPGIGKSTLCTAIAKNDTLYISSEENWNQVNNRVLRVNPNCNMDILSTTSFDEVCDAIRITDKKLIIIDSLNSIEFGVGYSTTARFASEITDLIKETGKIAIIISQVAKNGEIAGMQSLIHVVDTVLHLERSEVSSNIIATSSKNRYGEIGAVAVFKHETNGFKEIDIDHMNVKNEIGATYTETRFGHKNMIIAIEALVAPAQASFGLRSANGYNRNRLIQLLGIISYFGKLDLNCRDIYVAISNGLSTDDISIELAMANSILSSFYGKSVVSQAYGEIRLNGKISNGNIDGQKINHINDLIKMYK